jgi:cysteinyl-tRNA synthetase
LNQWKHINDVLNVEMDGAEIPPEIAKLAEARTQARLAKDFRKSDELRNDLSARGWEVRDTKDGQKVTRRAGG